MAQSLITYLGAQPILKLLRGLALAPAPRHLRDLAKSYSLSPAGVSDILRRLKELGVLREERRGNKRFFWLAVTPQERGFLDGIFRAYEQQVILERATRLSKGAAERLQWMDEAYQFFDQVKKARRDPT